jgi:hypothetical protein
MDMPAFEDLFKLIKINLSILGIPFGDPKVHYIFYLYVLSLTIVLIEELSFLFSKYSPENLLELTELTPCLVNGLLSMLKISSIAAKRQKIFELTNNLERLYSIVLEQPGKRRLIKKKIVIMRSFVKYFFLLNGILVSVYNFRSLFLMAYVYATEKKIIFDLPYGVILPFSTENWTGWTIIQIQLIIVGKNIM